ncbi:hypothetical protein ACHWQZ_G004192 [Mnemiopsis leidyi]
MTELTLEALQHFMLENGCKVKSSDAIEFFRLNFGGKDCDLSHNKDLFKKFMEQLTRADITENGERYLVLKRQHMVPVSPHPYHSPRLGRSSLNNSPRLLIRGERSLTTPPRSPRVLHNTDYRPTPAISGSAPGTLESGSTLIATKSCRKLSQQETGEEDELRSPVSGYDSEEFDEEDPFDEMELGSVGGCSNNQLEPNQKEWIYKTAIGDLDAVTRLLLQDRSLVKYKDFVSGYTGLHWACKLGRLDMVHVLIAADSDINARAFNGMTPLHMAAQCGYGDIIDVLIKEKADKLTRDNNGKYPVFYLPSRTPDKIKELLSPPPPPSSKPRNQPVSNDKPNFSLRRHKREKSDTGSDHHRSKTLNNNFKYQSLGKHSGSNKRPLSGIKIDHITLDGGGEAGATLVKSKEEALESVCSNSTLSPRSVKRISLGTNLSVLYDTEPLLLHHDSATNKGSNHVGFVEIEEDGRSRRSKRRTSLLCCCPRRRRRNSL